jgi:hypothetical protein
MTQNGITQKGFVRTGLALAIAAGLAIGCSSLAPAQAQFKARPRGAPSGSAGGASRSGSCVADKTPLTVLAPFAKTDQGDQKGQIGLTTEAHPTFFLYLPNNKAQVAEFALKDSKDNDVYRTMIALPKKPGVVSFQLPADAPKLEIGKDYQWFFSLVCQPTDRLRDAFTDAWIQRVAPDPVLITALKRATPRQRPNVYAQAGIWQDTLATLVDLQRTRPNDASLKEEWNRLLQSVGLGQIQGGPPSGQLSLRPIKTP